MTSICWGTTYNIRQYIKPNTTAEIEIGQLWDGPSDNREISATAVFRDDDGNMMYFPHTIMKDGLFLIAKVSTGSYEGYIKAQFSVLEDKTAAIKNIVEDIIKNLN
jgi:hypothetical protein